MPAIFKSFTNSIDKVFRYLIPGVVLFVCTVCAYPDIWSHYLNKISTGMLLLLIFSAGLVWCVVYRGFLTVFELLIIFRTKLTAVCLFKNPNSKIEAHWAKFVIVRQKIRIALPELSDYLDIRWSFVHLLTQSSIVFVIFSWFHTDSISVCFDWSPIKLASLMILAIAVVNHSWMYYMEKKLIQNLFKSDSKLFLMSSIEFRNKILEHKNKGENKEDGSIF
jgi:hypothetical protein